MPYMIDAAIKGTKRTLGKYSTKEIKICELMFADDVILVMNISSGFRIKVKIQIKYT